MRFRARLQLTRLVVRAILCVIPGSSPAMATVTGALRIEAGPAFGGPAGAASNPGRIRTLGVHETLEAWQHGEITYRRCLRLRGVSTIDEFDAACRSSGFPIWPSG
jgi:hypothetical protein